MKEARFFDTNILLYAYSTAEPEKQMACAPLVRKVFEGEMAGVISNQVLGEFFNAAVSKHIMPANEVAVVIKALIYSAKWQKVNYTHRTVEGALQHTDGDGTRFWDLLIAQTMKENGIKEILTEDRKGFAGIEGIRITNPFKQ